MDQELESLHRAYLSDKSNESVGRAYERQWLRSQSLDMTGQVVDLKLVYEGFGLSGKTTNFEQLQRIYHDVASTFYVGGHGGDRVLCFSICFTDDTLLGEWTGLTLRLGIYTVPGACYYQNTRRLLRKNADGFVFIPSRRDHLLRDSQDQYEDLQETMERPEFRQCPLIFQRNEGLSDAVPWDQICDAHQPVRKTVEANAVTGDGVKETLLTLLDDIVGSPLKRMELFQKRIQPLGPWAPNVGEGISMKSLG